MASLQDVLDALNAERYGPSLWWKADRPDLPPPPAQTVEFDDSDITTARRRKALLAAVDISVREDAV